MMGSSGSKSAALDAEGAGAQQASVAPHAGFAQAWWDIDLRKDRFESDLCDVLDGDFDRIGGDHYDNSLEIYGVENHVRLSEVAQRFIHSAGFSRVYVNHQDGWETHYTWDWREPEFAVVRGWRRKAKPDGKGFWISFWPASWTRREWLDSGYMSIEPDALEPAGSSSPDPAEQSQ